MKNWVLLLALLLGAFFTKATSRPKLDSMRAVRPYGVNSYADTNHQALNNWLLPLSVFKDSFQSSYNDQVPLDTLRLNDYSIKESNLIKNSKNTIELVQKIPPKSTNWLFYFIMTLVVLVVLVKSFFNKFVSDLFKAFWNLQIALQMVRQQDVQFSLPAILLMINFYLSASIYVFINLRPNNTPFATTEIWLIPVIAIGIGLFFTAKVFLYRISIILFAPKGEVRSIVLMDFILVQVIGVLLLPSLLIVGFTIAPIHQITTVCVLLLLAVAGVYRYFLSWRIAGSLLFSSVLHFIVYICCIEIAPVLLTLKIIEHFLLH